MATRISPEEKAIAEFGDWVETVPPHQLLNLVKDAFWKKQLRGTEIQRFFLLHQKGVDMRDKGAQT